MPSRTLQYYETHAGELVTSYEGADLSNVYGLFRQMFVYPCRLLELGGGSGRDAAYLAGQGHDLFFTDGSPAMVHEAVRLHPELADRSLVCRAQDSLPFSSARFDGIIAIALLMHLSSTGIVDTMREIHRVLKPGGKAVISAPSSRDDMVMASRDEKGRLMNLVDIGDLIDDELPGLFELVTVSQNSDGLNRRGIAWITYGFVKV